MRSAIVGIFPDRTRHGHNYANGNAANYSGHITITARAHHKISQDAAGSRFERIKPIRALFYFVIEFMPSGVLVRRTAPNDEFRYKIMRHCENNVEDFCGGHIFQGDEVTYIDEYYRFDTDGLVSSISDWFNKLTTTLESIDHVII